MVSLSLVRQALAYCHNIYRHSIHPHTHTQMMTDLISVSPHLMRRTTVRKGTGTPPGAGAVRSVRSVPQSAAVGMATR